MIIHRTGETPVLPLRGGKLNLNNLLNINNISKIHLKTFDNNGQAKGRVIMMIYLFSKKIHLITVLENFS